MKAELLTLSTSKDEVDELVCTLTSECTTLHSRVAAYQEELKIADEIWHGYELTLAAKDVELVATKEELVVTKKELAVASDELGGGEGEVCRNHEGIHRGWHQGHKLKVRADLYHEYRDGKASAWDVDKAIQEYKEAASESSSANLLAPGEPSAPSSPS